MLHKLNSPQLTLFALVWPSTFPCSTTKSWTHQTVHAIWLSKHLTTPLLSSIHCPRSHTVIAPLSCNCSETTLPSGPLQIARMLRLRQPMHQRRQRRSPSPRQSLRNPRPKLRLLPNLRLPIVLESLRLVVICFFDLTGRPVYPVSLGGIIAAWFGGWELLWKAESKAILRIANTPSSETWWSCFSFWLRMFYFPAVLLRVGACFADGALKPLEAGVFDIMECITFHRASTAYT